MSNKLAPDVEADQMDTPVEEYGDTQRLVEEESRRPRHTQDTMAGAADFRIGEIYDCTGRPIPIKPQPPGVWTAITNVVTKTISDAISGLNAEGLASLIILNEIKDSEGATAADMKANAIGTALKEALPRLIAKFSEAAPEALCEIVSMILEPNALVIRDGGERKYTVEFLQWQVPVGEQITAVSMYIDSLNLEELAGKVKALLPAGSLEKAAGGTH